MTVGVVITEGETQRKAALRITQDWYEEFRDREKDYSKSTETNYIALVRG